MKKIRKSIFETNSSSSHSVAVDMSADILDTLMPSNCIVIPCVDFNSFLDGTKITDALTKASYAAQLVNNDNEYSSRIEMVKRVIQMHTGFEVSIPPSSFYGSADNYNGNEIREQIFANDEALRMFIFNPKSVLTLEQLQ